MRKARGSSHRAGGPAWAGCAPPPPAPGSGRAARILAVVPSGAEQALVRAMVLGDRAGLDEDTAEAFRIAGTYHVLALSGAQVALIAALLTALARRAIESPALERLDGGGRPRLLRPARGRGRARSFARR